MPPMTALELVMFKMVVPEPFTVGGVNPAVMPGSKPFTFSVTGLTKPASAVTVTV